MRSARMISTDRYTIQGLPRALRSDGMSFAADTLHLYATLIYRHHVRTAMDLPTYTPAPGPHPTEVILLEPPGRLLIRGLTRLKDLFRIFTVRKLS
jgi:hypothetical protein